MKSHDERREGETPGTAVEADYEPPALVELGSFAELTQLGSGTNPDAEGTS